MSTEYRPRVDKGALALYVIFYTGWLVALWPLTHGPWWRNVAIYFIGGVLAREVSGPYIKTRPVY